MSIFGNKTVHNFCVTRTLHPHHHRFPLHAFKCVLILKCRRLNVNKHSLQTEPGIIKMWTSPEQCLKCIWISYMTRAVTDECFPWKKREFFFFASTEMWGKKAMTLKNMAPCGTYICIIALCSIFFCWNVFVLWFYGIDNVTLSGLARSLYIFHRYPRNNRNINFTKFE